MLLNGALWAPALARVLDTSLRYTVDKTTREILFLPLPDDLKQQAKPFVDVTVDRFAKGIGALLVLVLIKDLGPRTSTWQQLSYASLVDDGLWIFAAIRARTRVPGGRSGAASSSRTVAAAERAARTTPTCRRSRRWSRSSATRTRGTCIYAIDMLESLDKRHLVTPLLLTTTRPTCARARCGIVERRGAELRSAGCPASSGC